MFIDITSIYRDVTELSEFGKRGVVATVESGPTHANGTVYADDGTQMSFTVFLTEEENAHIQAIMESMRERIAQRFR